MAKINIILFGAPGAGKGTYGNLLSQHYGFPTFSVGNYFRSIIASNASAGDDFTRNLSQTLKSGKLVDDDTVMGVLKRIPQMPTFAKADTLLLDGLPRTLRQAQMMSS